MKILISNDDGVNSSGILAAKRAVEKLGEVIVVAPATQQSGIGRALTLFEPLRISQVNLNDGGQGFSVSGTPSDSIVLAIFELMDDKPDIIISGINTGENIGKGELTTSGTIAAAMEGASYGIPSIAISQQVLKGEIKFEEGHIDIDYSLSEKILHQITKKVLNKGLPNGVDLFNINVPFHTINEDILITKLGERMYNPRIETRLDPRGKSYYWIDGSPFKEHEKGTDGHALFIEKRPTLTPLSIDLSSNLELTKEWTR